MADRLVNGKDILFFIDPAGGTDYQLIVCLTSNSLNRATSVIDSASKCGPASTAGPTTVSIDLAGQVVVEPDTDHLAEADLNDLLFDDTVVGWKMGPAVPVTGDVSYSGTGFLSSLNATYDMNGATFSGTFQPSGRPAKAIEGES